MFKWNFENNTLLQYYFVFSYIVPALFFAIDPVFFQNKYNNLHNDSAILLTLLGLVGFYLICLLFYSVPLKLNYRYQLSHRKTIYFLWIVALVQLVCAFYYFIHHDIGFRHSLRVSDARFFVALLPFTKAFFLAFGVKIFSERLREMPVSLSTRMILLLSAVSFLISVNASFDLLYVALFVGLSVFPKRSFKIIFNSGFTWFHGALLFFALVLPILVGVFNKYSVEAFYSLYMNDMSGVKQFLNELMARLSTPLVSAINLVHLHNFNEISYGILEDTFGRIGQKVSGFLRVINSEWDTTDATAIYGVNRYNYLILYQDASQLKRTGASPGLFGSALFFDYVLLGILMVGLYTAFILRLFNRIFCQGNTKLNFISKLTILVLALPLFESPLEFLALFNHWNLYLFLLIFISVTEVKDAPTKEAKSILFRK